MSGFKTMDPETIWKLLEGQEDVLSPAAQKEIDFLKTLICPNCGGTSHQISVDVKRPFSQGSLLPNRVASCLSCMTQFEPYSRIIRKSSTDV